MDVDVRDGLYIKTLPSHLRVYHENNLLRRRSSVQGEVMNPSISSLSSQFLFGKSFELINKAMSQSQSSRESVDFEIGKKPANPADDQQDDSGRVLSKETFPEMSKAEKGKHGKTM